LRRSGGRYAGGDEDGGEEGGELRHGGAAGTLDDTLEPALDASQRFLRRTDLQIAS
jgi:hypothetical protein